MLGDTDALTELLVSEGPALRARLANEVPARWRSVLSADDVMQETYIDAFLDVKQFVPRGPGAFTAWLVTLARRNLVDAIRMLEAEKRGRSYRRLERRATDDTLVALHEQLGRAPTTPSGHAARSEACSHLEQAIAQLPPAYRQVIEMYDLEGRPVAEVAAALSRSTGAVFMLRSRAHRLLSANLGTASRYLSDVR
jgi:RNA polymerase sigma factor (sigma-70 family)